ncbi:relaxase/mobilization nuclease domain-containing protein [Staphylococcus aureus]|nr:relaxase/mobilization nuclease domain-containing protein [Staphylococcus aureus]
MATIQLGTTRSASRLCNYAEKRAVVKDGHNLDIDYAKSQMKQTRELFSKNDGIQAHHVIQSFKPNEVTPEKANQVGLELAEKLAKDHEVAVYTHADKDHIHNHIVINSVNFETGKKYQAHGKEAIERARSLSDEVCKNHNLSIVTEHNASVRHTLAEQHLLEKNKPSWKDELREAIEYARNNSTNFDSFKKHLNDVYGVETKLRGKTLSFKHPERERFIRANKLGADYEREGLENVFTRQAKREQEHERTVSRDQGTQRTNEKLYQSSHERGNGERSQDSQSIESNTVEIGRSHEEHAVNLERAREDVERKHRSFAKDFDRWTRGNSKEQQQDHSSTGGTSKDKQRSIGRNERGNQVEREEHAEQSKQRRQKSKTRDDGLSL